MFSTTLLVGAAAALALAWAFLGAWVIAERYLHDRRLGRCLLDQAAWSDGRLDLGTLRQGRLTPLALAPRSAASSAAAVVLANSHRYRLVSSAVSPRTTDARLQSLTILVRGGSPDALELIRHAIGERDPALTTNMLRLAAELRSAESDALLLEVLIDGTHPRARTATELEPRASRLHSELVALSLHDDAVLRYWAITLLTRAMRDRAVAAAVASRANDDDPNVRAAVAEALGGVPKTVARPVLRGLLKDDAFFVRSHAARSVAKLGDGVLARNLLPLLADRNWWVRAAAKESLLQLGDKGFETARAALGHPDRFARDGALEIILGSGRLQDLVAAADVGVPAAAAAVASIRAQAGPWATEVLSPALPAAPRKRDREAAAA